MAEQERVSSRLSDKPRLTGQAHGAGWLTGRIDDKHSGPSELDVVDDSGMFAVAVLAGGCASASVDVSIYPLDTLKTRMQAPQGFAAAGAFRGLFRGVMAAALGAFPGGAAFFGAYECSRVSMHGHAEAHSPWVLDATAACIGATASCVLRNPALVVQQRMQVGQHASLRDALSSVAREGAFYNGLAVSIFREIPFAFIQFPIYEALKRLWSGRGTEELTPSQGALCGAIAGSVAAAATTPLDLLKTRQMLGHARGGIAHEVRTIVREDGASGLFRGILPRVGWMAIGGYIFFGVYEKCVSVLSAMYRQRVAGAPKRTGGAPREAAAVSSSSSSRSQPDTSTPSASHASHGSGPHESVPAHIGLLAGGFAGMVIDAVLYPIDTLKTRTIQGSASMRELHTLWNGIGAAMLPAIPAAAAFFFTYEGVKNELRSDSTSACCTAAITAEAAACVIRVPAELVKMNMQANPSSSLAGAMQGAWQQGGLRGLYRGLGATLCLDIPFALLQMPLYENLRVGIVQYWRPGSGSSPTVLDGAVAGGIAGATAAFITTPLDVVRTRHVLWPLQPGEVRSLGKTVASVHKYEGLGGFWRGVLPRTIYMGLGGMVYLGTYSYASKLLLHLMPSSTRS